MIRRLLLIAVAGLALGWLGLGLRSAVLRDRGVGVLGFRLHPSAAQFARGQRLLRDSELLDPDPTAELDRATFYGLRAQPGPSRRLAEGVVRREPENPDAWRVLAEATRQTDPRRAAQAAAHIKRLNPLGS